MKPVIIPDDLMRNALALSNRRRNITKNFKQKCCKCRSNQIQLVDAKPIAKWRCRECHTEFRFEPLIVVK